MSKQTQQREQVQKGLQHLKGSDKIIGDIVAYCVQVYKADPSPKTIEKIRKYVEDTCNSVSEHVLTIAHNLNRIVDQEAKEIEDLSYQTKYVSHRLYSHQKYMSELFMTKFQTFPRPRPTIHILRQAIPENQLPRYARRKRPWQRQTEFNYKILDQVGARRTGNEQETGDPNAPASPRFGPNGVNSPSTSAMSQSQPKPAVKPFNPYESKSPETTNNNSKSPMSNRGGGPTLFQQSQQSGFGFGNVSNFSAAPPSFGSAQQPPDPNTGRGMSASVVKYVGGDPSSPKNKPPAVPKVGGPPDIPPMANNGNNGNNGGGGGGPSGGPPPPPVPNFAAAFAAPPQQPPQPPGPSQDNVGGPPQPPVPPVPNASGPPVPPVPNASGPPQPPQPPQPPPPPM